MRSVELRQHTGNEGDKLSPKGADTQAIADRLHPPYLAFVSTGAQRANQMLEILRHDAGQDAVLITESTGLRSSIEDRWREAASAAGKGADLEAMRSVDPDLVEKESYGLRRAPRSVLDEQPEGGKRRSWATAPRGGIT
ncbi:MAG TPA: hypothetical protein VGL18_04360 [Actinomycetota bacterium]|jgi:hypothetical protein